MPDNTTNNQRREAGTSQNSNDGSISSGTQTTSPIRLKPVETVKANVEPTASFNLDITLNAQVYPSLRVSCLVHFRPSRNWKKDSPEYCYGFDWLRIGDSGDWSDKKKVDDHYANLIGRYYEVGTNNECNDPNTWKKMKGRNGNPCEFRHEPNLYLRHLRDSFPKAFFVPIKSRNKSICSDKISTEVKRLINRSECYYTVPILFLTALGQAKIKVKVEDLIEKEGALRPKNIVFREHTNGNGAFTITPNKILPQTKWQEITITSQRETDQFELIDAIAIYDDPANPTTDKEMLCGQLRIHPNNYTRTVNILYVLPDTYKGAVQKSQGVDFLSKEEKSFIKKIIEGQLLANVNIEYYTLPMVRGNYTWTEPNGVVTGNIDNYTDSDGTVVTQRMTDILTAAFRDDLATVAANAPAGSRESDITRYDNCFVVFLVNLDSRTPPSTNPATRKATIYKRNVGANEGEVSKKLRETVLHEILHTLRLKHSFTAHGIDPTYRARETENIMDYSHVDESMTNATGLDRYSLWYWQIKKIWRLLDNQVRERMVQLNAMRQIVEEPQLPIGIPDEDSNMIPATNNGLDNVQFLSTPRI